MRLSLVAALVAAISVSLGAGYHLLAAAPSVDDGSAAYESSAASSRIALTSADRKRAELAGVLPHETRSILSVSRRLDYGEFVWSEADVPVGEIVINVDLRRQMISVFRGGHEIGTAVILYGAEGHDTPLGDYPVRAKTEDYHSISYDAPMPYAVWLTGDGVAIHASEVGRGRATHGCIGVPLGFARRLYNAVHVGDSVIVGRSSQT